MPTFILRVQLSREIDRNYTLLRDSLLNMGFTKRVTAKTGIEYRLPNGNYRIESNSEIGVILKAVNNIATQIDSNPMIFICEVKDNNMAWAHLQQC